MVALYEEMFGEPPVDPAGVLPEAPAPVVAAAVDAVELEPVEEQQTLLAWLRRVFGGGAPGASSVRADETPPPANSFPLPEGLQPELPVLPMAEIEARLLTGIEVPNSALTALAERRARAARDYLRGAGVGENRLILAPVVPGEAQVTMDLR